MEIRVLHAYYGCDTGCCGHIVEVDDEQVGQFEFTHFDESDKDYKEQVRDFILSKLPKECHDTIDWSTVEVDHGGCSW